MVLFWWVRRGTHHHPVPPRSASPCAAQAGSTNPQELLLWGNSFVRRVLLGSQQTQMQGKTPEPPGTEAWMKRAGPAQQVGFAEQTRGHTPTPTWGPEGRSHPRASPGRAAPHSCRQGRPRSHGCPTPGHSRPWSITADFLQIILILLDTERVPKHEVY